MRIIGIDPGTAICGYGIIDVQGSKLTPVAYGAITTPKELTDAQRLEILFNDLSDILEEYKPDKFGVEELFFREKIKPDDTADALAVAICTAHSSHQDRLMRLIK